MPREIIAITGHRDYPDRAALFRGLDGLKADEYIFGGARGVDNDALEYLGKTQPRSVRTVVVPNRLQDQSSLARETIKNRATQVIELKNTGNNRWQLRNRYMVDHSTKVHAFYDFRKSGGTYNTIEYARSIGKPFETTPLVRINERTIMSMNKGSFFAWLKKMKHFKVKLRSIKGIIINYLKDVAGITVQDLLKDLNVPGVNSLEGYWQQ